ncbi:MAG: FtsH protease activity modulator HflK [Betaproteobacteria bacterium]|nr:FtsH protease activity modulator HflK [Betaproteobacteria bacterium]
MGNEPQWGRRGNDGPPDLDVLWKKLNERLSALFGRKRLPASGPVNPLPALALVVGLLLLVWLASGFYIVNAGERGVVLRFGRYAETSQPGAHWHFPYPIETKYVVNVDRVHTAEVGFRESTQNVVPQEALMLTADQNLVNVPFAVQYVVTDPRAYLFNDRSPREAVGQVAAAVMRAQVGRLKADALLADGGRLLAPAAQKRMQDVLDRYRTGIAIRAVQIQGVSLPAPVKSAFADVLKAAQDRERAIDAAQAYASQVVAQAQAKAMTLVEQAKGYRSQVVDDAQGDVSRFNQVLGQYEKAPAVTRERMYLDTMQEVLTHTTKVLVDEKNGGNTLYLPLDKLIPSAPAALPQPAVPVAPPAVSTTVAPPPTTAVPILRSRDAFRSREREPRP